MRVDLKVLNGENTTKRFQTSFHPLNCCDSVSAVHRWIICRSFKYKVCDSLVVIELSISKLYCIDCTALELSFGRIDFFRHTLSFVSIPIKLQKRVSITLALTYQFIHPKL